MKKKIQSILIANRGEIAVRVIRTCKEMGIRTVAVYSDADKTSLHSRLADESYNIGPPESTLSYLVKEKIIQTALDARCDAIHPGYGFLSENPSFAQQVEESGLIFIGPSASAIRAMGDKTAARALMKKCGVPTVPGTESAINSEEEAIRTSSKIGYPVLIKAAAGGGGKGMRIVRQQCDFITSMHAAQNEARAAFGDDRVYIEKYLENPRHIEFQILADSFGNVVHLGERECSIQRRHQKLIEESPSVIVNEEMRSKMGEAAVVAAREGGYLNAGTIEFLVDKNLNYYFLEMNTRLQVEHTVTEMVTGIDLVKTQIRIAQGERLPISQKGIQQRGHAIECRLCAEDVHDNFFPSTGKIEYYKPGQGFGVREDSGIYEGCEISRYYDPMFAKLLAWGETRSDAIARMKRALREYRIIGVETTIPFCLYVLDHQKFIDGDFDTQFVQAHFDVAQLESVDSHLRKAAALAVVIAKERNELTSLGKEMRNGTVSPFSKWRMKAREERKR